MKEINIKYSEYIINVLLSANNTSITDSYRIRRIDDMVNVLKKIRNTCDNSYANTREVYLVWLMNGEYIIYYTSYI